MKLNLFHEKLSCLKRIKISILINFRKYDLSYKTDLDVGY